MSDAATVYACGSWELDLSRRELRALGVPVVLGGRAFDLLEVLARGAGSLVTKDELMRRLWPGIHVADNTLQVHVLAVRNALGPDRTLLKTEHGRGYRLLGAWEKKWNDGQSAIQGKTTPPAAGTRSPGNLPWSGSAVIGRDSALREIEGLMAAHRLVTLTGVGGIGKTRLAITVARSALARFAGGVWLVDLAPVADPRLVPLAVSGALGLELGGAEISAAAVARAIGSRELLLLLDNCEHLVGAAARLVDAVVRTCARTALLVTSRELLRIEGECVYQVAALDVPTPAIAAPEALLAHSAVQLFLARMRAARSDFAPAEGELWAIAMICRRLDGIPLALEFAAARAATLGLEPVLARLDERFQILAGGRRTALPRHRTLRAAVDWSYDLLPEDERRLLRFLSVFPAGFTLEAAVAVAGTPESMAAKVVEGIANLVAKSLVARNDEAGAGRWRLLETIRTYALGRLAEAGEAEAATRRHADYVRGLAAPTLFERSMPVESPRGLPE